MDVLISKKAIIDFYNTRFPTLDNGVHWSRNDIIQNLDNIPAVDPTEVITRLIDGIICDLIEERDDHSPYESAFVVETYNEIIRIMSEAIAELER